jgi:hypothetical protein
VDVNAKLEEELEFKRTILLCLRGRYRHIVLVIVQAVAWREACRPFLKCFTWICGCGCGCSTIIIMVAVRCG